MGRVLSIHRRYHVSVPRNSSETADRVPFGPGVQLLSPVSNHDSCNSSFNFTRPLSLAPHPPVAGRIRNNSSRGDSAACAGIHCQGAFDGSLRCPPQPIDSWRLNTRSVTPHHGRRTDNHHRGFAPPRKLDLLSDSRRTEFVAVSSHCRSSLPQLLQRYRGGNYCDTEGVPAGTGLRDRRAATPHPAVAPAQAGPVGTTSGAAPCVHASGAWRLDNVEATLAARAC